MPSIDTVAKTAASAAGGIVAWGTAAATLFALVPDKRVAGVVSVLLLVVHVAQSFLVWLTKNEPVIDADAHALEDVVAAVGNWRGELVELKNLITAITRPVVPGPPGGDAA